MGYPTLELELLESMKSLNANQKDDVLTFVRSISSQNLMKSRNRKNALREIRTALRNRKF